MKRKLLDIKLVTRESFHNKRSYEAALYAVAICNKIITRTNAGDIVFEYENLVAPDFEIDSYPDGTFEGLYVQDSESCKVQIVGDVEDGVSGLIYCTKRDIREFFQLWRIATITNVNKVCNLTK